jgi:hypothetical protein
VWTVLNLLEHAELIYGHLLGEVRREKLVIPEEPLEARIRQSEQQRRQVRTVLDQTRRPSVGSMEMDADTLEP